MTIKYLVLSGGAYKGFYTIGALKHLSEINFYDINNIRKDIWNIRRRFIR